MTDHHPAFEPLRSHRIDNLQLTVEEYRHRVTGAKHIHLAAANRENVFLVAFRTLPTNSRGTAHILEHTALCGSERYPVRDPFFWMLRRSLNTFMNAFTSSDFTAYPFASQNRKDFFNLLDVYLDAVFFCALDPLDFAQEGHRLEFEQPDDPSTPLTYRGVVYNEMKGDQSSVISHLYETLKRYLYPTTTYHHNSGGDPEQIPDLSHEELVEFHRTYYAPGNAIFMTYGDIGVHDVQARMEEQGLSRFSEHGRAVAVGEEQRYHAPLRVQEHYPLPASESGEEERTHIVIAWLLGRNTDLEELLHAHLLSDLLLDNSASPLRHALETTSLGRSVSPLCGLEDSNREICFMCGIEGSEAERAGDLEQLVEGVLRAIAEEGIPSEDVEAVLHQLELHQREIGGDGYPYGLQLMMGALSSAIHGGDPAAMLDLEPVLEKLRSAIADPGFVRTLVRDQLLANPHRVTLVLAPDSELGSRRDEALQRKLSALRARLTPEQADEIVTLAARLKARQEAQEPVELLPKVSLDDIETALRIPQGEARMLACGVPLSLFGQGTNGLVYQQLVSEMPQMADELLQLLPYYTFIVTEVGSGSRDYLATQRLQHRFTGGLSAFSSFRCDVEEVARASGYMTLSTRALVRNFDEMARLLGETRTSVGFDEPQRVAELISQTRARRDASITNAGTQLVLTAAASGLSPVTGLNHRLGGLEGIRFLRRLDDELSSRRKLHQLCDALGEVHHRFREAPCQLLLIAEPRHCDELAAKLEREWSVGRDGDATFAPLTLAAEPRQLKQVWTTNTRVNFCARVYPTVPEGHPDAAALIVLGGVIRNGFLHTEVREKGGAYGAGASQDSANGVFRFSSFRDPNLLDTLQNFDRAIDWFLSSEVTFGQVEEAILGVVSSIDAPGSPAGEARQAFHNALFGRTAAHREKLREAILGVTVTDLRAVVERYLAPERASTALLTSAEGAGAAGLDGFEVLHL